MKLATPEGFASDPKLVWEWYRERRQRISDAQPNAAHEAIAKLARQSREFLLVTQNVDDLHARAGLPKDKMVQIHGDIFVTRCSCCDFSDATSSTPAESLAPSSHKMIEELDCFKQSSLGAVQDVDVPKCAQCGELMRPGVVWFGEQLDLGEIQRVEDFLGEGTCDLALVIGSTAAFGYIIDWAVRAAGKRGRLIEVNPEETPLSQFATQLVREPAAGALPRLVEALECGDMSPL